MLSLATDRRAVPLTTTVTHEGVAYTRLFVREPTERDLGPAPSALSDEDVARLLAARICRVPLNVVRALSPADEVRLFDLIEPLLRQASTEIAR